MIIPFLSVSPSECARKQGVTGNCKNDFMKLVKMSGKLEEVCQEWGINNLNVDNVEELLKFTCIIGNEWFITFSTLSIYLIHLFDRFLFNTLNLNSIFHIIIFISI